MDTMEAILTRRSIRQYTGEPVSEGEIRKIIRAGAHAPSAHNRQPWHFVVIRDPKLILRVAEVHPYAKMAPQAGSCIVVCGDTTCQEEVGFLVEDCSAAIENMLIASTALGYGSCWVEGDSLPREEEFKTLLGVPKGKRLLSLVPVGVPEEWPTIEKRSLESVLHWQVY